MKSLVFQEGKFSIKKEPAAALNRGKNPFILTTLSKDPLILLSFDFSFFRGPSPRLLTLVMVLAECKQRKQSSRGVLRKRCSENTQQIYKTPMSKCEVKKVASHFGMDFSSKFAV